MVSEGTKKAQNLIAELSAQSPKEYAHYLNQHIQIEASKVLQEARHFGWRSTFNIPHSREDFDKIYDALKAAGIKNTDGHLQSQIDYLKELKKNPDPIGMNFMAEVKAARIKMVPFVARHLEIPESEIQITLQDIINPPAQNYPGITDIEKEYIAARRLLGDYSLQNEIYKSSAYDVSKSPWAERIREENKNKLVNSLLSLN